MNGQPALTECQLALLRRVAQGEFRHAASVPDELASLIDSGYVTVHPGLLFPIMPSRRDYRLTPLGEQVLARPN